MVLAFAGDSTITSAPRAVDLAGLAAALATGLAPFAALGALAAGFSAAAGAAFFLGAFLALVGTDDLVEASTGPPHPSLELRLDQHPHDRSERQPQTAREPRRAVPPLLQRGNQG